jgi:hypothetical protein
MTTKEEKKEPATATTPDAVVSDIIIPEKESLEVQKDVLEHVPREEEIEREHGEKVDVSAWMPKTDLGRKVKSGVFREVRWWEAARVPCDAEEDAGREQTVVRRGRGDGE